MRAQQVLEAVESLVSHRLARARGEFDKAVRKGLVHPKTELKAEYLEYLRAEVRDLQAGFAELVAKARGLADAVDAETAALEAMRRGTGTNEAAIAESRVVEASASLRAVLVRGQDVPA